MNSLLLHRSSLCSYYTNTSVSAYRNTSKFISPKHNESFW